ncbi:IclR family transcriptional regulator [Prauserella oleivorans]|uniref:IclR family transcriptional regulator n=1 Tax=Prauserella oleivorans TaxID=1478153 RepID=A0ABW5WC55_9PSEU
MAGNTSTPGATVVSRTLSVLYAFDNAHRRLSATEVARRAGLPVPTTHRLLRELVAGDALVRGEDGRYAVGRRLWDVGLLAPDRTDLRHVASPFLSDIHAATRATVHLAVRDGLEVLYLDRLSGRASVPVVSRTGSRLPLHATGVGKVLLAYAPDDVRERVLAGPLPRLTAHTITQPGWLREQLDTVRRAGYATTTDEMTLGACSIAVPITRPASAATEPEVVAALGIVVPTLKRARTRLLTALQIAAQGIARNLH